MANEQPPRPEAGTLVIEVGDKRNDNVVFPPTQERYRGRWSAHQLALGDTSAVGLMQLPPIPGIYLMANARARKVAVVDPLSLPEHKSLLDQVSKLHKALWQRECGPRPGMSREDLSPDEMASWVYWMMRLVRDGMAFLVSGTLPESEEDVVKLVPKARIRREYFSTEISKSWAQDQIGEMLRALQQMAGQAAAVPAHPVASA